MRIRPLSKHQAHMLKVIREQGPLTHLDMEVKFPHGWSKTWRALLRVGEVEYDSHAPEEKGYRLAHWKISRNSA